MLLVEVRRSKFGLVSPDTTENFCLQTLLILVQISYSRLKLARKMHGAIQWATELDSSMEVKNTVNIQHIIWFMQGMYYQ